MSDTKGPRPGCNVCGRLDEAPRFEKDGYPIVSCRCCGLVYVSPLPRDEEIAAAYGPDYYADSSGVTYTDYFSHPERMIAAFRYRLQPILRRVPAGRLLDVGCAAGYFLVAARQTFDVHGVELSDAAAAFGRAQFGVDISVGPLDGLDFPAESFDVITMWDTIEHLRDPAGYLREAYRLLKPGGLLVASTADVESWTARWFGSRWILYAPPWHLYYFSPRTVTLALSRAGFQVEKIDRSGVPFLNVNAPTGVAAVVSKVLANRYSSRALGALGIGFIMTVFAGKPRPGNT